MNCVWFGLDPGKSEDSKSLFCFLFIARSVQGSKQLMTPTTKTKRQPHKINKKDQRVTFVPRSWSHIPQPGKLEPHEKKNSNLPTPSVLRSSFVCRAYPFTLPLFQSSQIQYPPFSHLSMSLTSIPHKLPSQNLHVCASTSSTFNWTTPYNISDKKEHSTTHPAANTHASTFFCSSGSTCYTNTDKPPQRDPQKAPEPLSLPHYVKAYLGTRAPILCTRTSSTFWSNAAFRAYLISNQNPRRPRVPVLLKVLSLPF